MADAQSVNRKRSIRRAAVWAAAVLVVAGAGVAAYVLSPEPLPAADAPREALVRFAATERFAKLPSEQKQPYLDAMQKWNWQERSEALEKANLDEAQRRQMFRNAMGSMMLKRAGDYMALTDENAKRRYLDERINEMEAMRAAANAAQALAKLGGNTPNAAPRMRPMDPARMKQMMEEIAPDDRAKMAAFMAAMEARRRERNLPPWHGSPQR